MQVFLPLPSLKDSVTALDPKRLGNQIYRECKTLINGGWPYHPASKMWSGYKPALAVYALYGLEELACRGRFYPHHVDYFKSFLPDGLDLSDSQAIIELCPGWLGNEQLHSSHRAALLYKDYKWYSQFGWKEQPAVPFKNGKKFSLPYYWPS